MAAHRGILALAAAALLAACGGDTNQITTPREAGRPRLTITGVGIFGSTLVQRYADCFWAADVTGGTPPYSYTWRNSGIVGTSYGDTFEGQMVGSAGLMRVKVTDSLGAQDSASLSVQGSPSGQC